MVNFDAVKSELEIFLKHYGQAKLQEYGDRCNYLNLYSNISFAFWHILCIKKKRIVFTES
jgi:hypothetical protein